MPYILLTNGLVLAFKNNDPEPHVLRADVLIENETIVDVKLGLDLPKGSEGEVVDCTGKWITPGQIDTHRSVEFALSLHCVAFLKLIIYVLHCGRHV